MDKPQRIGLGGFVAPERMIAIGRWDSAPIRRAARKANADGRLIDLTYGRDCKWVFFMDTGHVVLGTNKIPDRGENDGK